MEEEYIYLKIPTKYKQVYIQLLQLMSNYGVDILKDCSSTCKGRSKTVFNCWVMFQGACCSYTLGQTKQADLLINYIIKQLRLNILEEDIEPIIPDEPGGDDTPDEPTPPVTTKYKFYAGFYEAESAADLNIDELSAKAEISAISGIPLFNITNTVRGYYMWFICHLPITKVLQTDENTKDADEKWTVDLAPVETREINGITYYCYRALMGSIPYSTNIIIK